MIKQLKKKKIKILIKLELEKIKTKSKNLPIKEKNGGIPANDKKRNVTQLITKELLERFLKSLVNLKIEVSINKIKEKNTNNVNTYTIILSKTNISDHCFKNV